jgi:hypothetical protein
MIYVSDHANGQYLDGMGRGAITLLINTDVPVSGVYLPLALFQITDILSTLDVAGPSRTAQADERKEGTVEQPYTEKERWYIEVPSRSK